MEANEVLNYFLTKAFNKTEDEVKALLFDGDKLKDGAGDELIKLDQARVAKIKEASKVDGQTYFDNGFKKAQKETLTAFEKQFKEKTGYDSDLQGLDLIMEWGEKQKKIKVEDVKLHPDYLKLEKTIKDKETDYMSQLENLKKGFDKEKQLTLIKDHAKKVLNSGAQTPVIPSSPVVAQNIENVFLSQLGNYDYQLQEDGNHIVIKDGKRVEDAHGNPITFETHVRNHAAAFYEFKKQEDKGNAGNKGGGGFNFGVIKTKEDFNKAIAAAKTPKERMAIMDEAKKAGIEF